MVTTIYTQLVIIAVKCTNLNRCRQGPLNIDPMATHRFTTVPDYYKRPKSIHTGKELKKQSILCLCIL